MPLVHVSPRETSLQSTASATPYSFLSPSSFIPEARMGSGGDTAFFLASRDRSMNLGSNCASSGVSSDGITYLAPSLGQYQNTELPSLSSVPSDGSEFNGFTQKDTKRESENWAPTDSSQQPMNQLQQAQTHVAQQSRREKLRIPGSLHPASPQSGTHSDHSAGSASALEVRQGAPVQQSEHMETSAQMRYSNQTNMNDVLPVYNASLISADPFNFPTGAELLAMSAKNNGYMGNSVADMLPQSPALVGTIYPGQAVAFPNQAMMSKGTNWNNGNGQLGQSNPLPGMPANGTHANGLTVLVGSGMQSGSFGSSVKDGYFSGSNPQAEMQLYLMNAGGYSGYTDATSGGNMVFITSPNGGVAQNNLVSRAPNHHLVGTPVESQNAVSHGSAVNSSSYGSLSSSIVGSRSVYSNWRNADELVFMPSSEATQRTNSQSNTSMGPMTDIPEYNNRPSPLPGQQQTLLQAGIGHRLEENIQNGHVGYHTQHPQSHGFDVQLQLGVNNSATINSAEAQAERTAQFVNKINKIQDLSQFRPIPKEATSPTGYPNLVSGNVGKHMHIDQSLSALSGSFNFISNSRYLKPAQQVLDEACSVGRTLKPSNSRQRGGSQAWTGQSQAANSTFSKDGTQDHASNNVTTGASTGTPTTVSSSAGTTMPSSNVTECAEVTAVRTPEERQDLESKKTKLVAMLQEVDRRYRQYYDQMQVVISSFDAVAGVGAAVPYTALALQAMSRYFRCLRDAVTGQIQATCTALGEEDISKQITSRGSSRLRIVDQQLRQQRAFQQLGMLHHNAWRPQRGLPERSVSILRAWLFEHFLHPYPKDADKLMLARQTGLSRSQVSNWFINARVRLWKPMVEEMYQEEARDEGDVPLVRLNVDGDGDGDGDGSCSDKSGKAESKHEENAKATTNDSKLQSEGGQDFLDGGSLSSDYMISNTHSLRRQGVGIGTCAQDVQLFEEAQKETMRQAQLKKSRYGIEDSILSTNAGIEVDMKPQDTNNVNVCENDHKFANTDRANNDQYSISQSNGVLHANFPSYEGNMARYGSTAFASGYPGNGVSLTLGLRHSENLSLCGAQQAYIHSGQTFTIGRRDNVASEHDFSNLYDGNALSGSHIGENEVMDYQSRKHIESQLLHDFVA